MALLASTSSTKQPPKPKGRKLPALPRGLTGSGMSSGVVGGSSGLDIYGRTVTDPGRSGVFGAPSYVTVDPLEERGSSGLKRARGILLEETLRELRGRLGVRVYREIYDNCTVIAAGLYLYKLILRSIKMNVVARIEGDSECEKWADFCAECCEDMDHRLDEMLSEAYTMLVYGWAYFEEVYKFRLGPNPGFMLDDKGNIQLDRFGNPKLIPPSKFTDGRVGWKRIPMRAQDTLQEWRIDENGMILGMLQNDPWSEKGAMRYLPMEKSLLFRTEAVKGNPEGRSILRACVPTWRIVKRLMEAEAVGVTRDVTGLTVVTVPAEAMVVDPIPEMANVRSIAEKIATSLAMHEEMGLVLPSILDKNGHQLMKVELLGTQGHRLWPTGEIIARYEGRMLTSVIMQFLLLGQDKVGSWALSDDQSDATVMCINSIAETAADVYSDIAFPRLVEINGGDPSKAPKMKITPAAKTPSLDKLGIFLRGLGTLGVGLVEPGSRLEQELFSRAGLTPPGSTPIFGDDAVPDPATQRPPKGTKKPAQGVDPEGGTAQPSPGTNNPNPENPPPGAKGPAPGTDPKKQAPPPKTGTDKQV